MLLIQDILGLPRFANPVYKTRHQATFNVLRLPDDVSEVPWLAGSDVVQQFALGPRQRV